MIVKKTYLAKVILTYDQEIDGADEQDALAVLATELHLNGLGVIDTKRLKEMAGIIYPSKIGLRVHILEEYNEKNSLFGLSGYE